MEGETLSSLLLVPLDDIVVFPNMTVTVSVDVGDDGRISSFVRSIREIGALADTVAYAPELTFEQKIELLETVDVVERLDFALRLQRERLAEMQVRRRIRDDVEEGAAKQQREYIL